MSLGDGSVQCPVRSQKHDALSKNYPSNKVNTIAQVGTVLLRKDARVGLVKLYVKIPVRDALKFKAFMNFKYTNVEHLLELARLTAERSCIQNYQSITFSLWLQQ